MKCDNCGYENSEFNIICEKCGSPLNIEKNIELQKKYNHKQRAIDIEEITPDNHKIEFVNTKKKVRIALIIFILLLLFSSLILTFVFMKEFRENDILNKYNEFVDSADLGVIYLGYDNDINNLLVSYSNSYEFKYLYVPTGKITTFKKNRILNNMKIKNNKSSLVIVKNGEVLAHLDEKLNNNNVLTFLQKNDILPKYIGDSGRVIELFDNSLKSQEPMVIYIANNKNDSNQKHHKKLEKFCDDYSINYTFIEGYYLTDNQKLKILSKLNYSEIHDEIIAIIDEGIIKEVDEFLSNDERDYFEMASNHGIIDISSAKSLKNINFNKLKEIINNKDKAIIMISSNDCIYCERLKPIIGKIGIQNNINIYHFVVIENERSLVEEYLSSLGYKDNKTTPPLIIITENNQLLDYIIGLSDKSLYEEKFRELGVIR